MVEENGVDSLITVLCLLFLLHETAIVFMVWISWFNDSVWCWIPFHTTSLLSFVCSTCPYSSQVSRSIGDAYLKRPEFALDPSFPRFHLPQPLQRPVLRADPSIVTRQISRDDKFLIFASDGLWEYLTNQEAVEIVHNNPRTVRFYFSHYF